ncbi:MAG TPA: carboxypeptidase regulatory-like domain-containing protein [Terriglobales bacterium]
MNKTKLTVSILFLLLISAFVMAQQSTTGVITGLVTEQSGAVVPGANVEARNTDTNYVRTAKSDAGGRFTFAALPPGPYKVVVSGVKGFATVVQENLVLTVGQTITLNVGMKVAAVQEQVVVNTTATIDLVKTESSTTIDNEAVSTLPVLGRKFEDLLTLTPGVSISQGPDGDEINFAGQRGIFNNISIDGGDYNNGFFGEQMGGQRAAVDITLDAIGEFQVVATGANAEFGRTAGGVVNVVTKSGTNQVHGSAFEFFRDEALTSNTSDGKPLDGFRRNQFGGTIGGPIKKDKVFFFGAAEHIRENLNRANLSQAIGTECPLGHTPLITNAADAAAIADNVDCQRLALVNFYKTQFNDNEDLPVVHSIRNTAVLGKIDWNVTNSTKLSGSYNFDHSDNHNQTFDVATYGTSANGEEGPSKIHAINLNGYTTFSQNVVNEAHIGFSRENRPRETTASPISADTSIGTSDSQVTFRFGHPFFLQPNVDEVFWRAQLRDNLTWTKGKHTFKTGGEWVHSRNGQVFRGFFQGRYLFGSTVGFLHYAMPASTGLGYGPNALQCADGSWTTAGTGCADESSGSSPLLLYLQGAGLTGPATDAAGYSNIKNEDFAYFFQDKWQITRNLTLNYGLRWEAQIMPDPVIPPSETVYAPYLSNPLFPSSGTIPSQKKEFQPRVGLAWDVTGKQKSVLRLSAGIYNGHQNMLTQVGSITTNGVFQQTLTQFSGYGNPVYSTANNFELSGPYTAGAGAGVRAFDRNYKNPRIYTGNAQFEQQVANGTTMYLDFTWSKGVYLTNFIDYNRADRGAPFATLGETMITSSRANSLYRGLTIGARRHLTGKLDFEANYVYSQDWDNDSNERDPFTDLSVAAPYPDVVNMRANYAPSNRDMRHRFNAFVLGQLPFGIHGDLRFQAHSAQPVYVDARNDGRKDNAYTSVDWRISRPFKFKERIELIPTVEMFNTFNSKNNVNTLGAPALFDFNGFLRKGVGDPRQAQLAIKLKF